MKHNFHYEVIKMDRQLWYVRCEDNACNWCVRAECLKDSAYFVIKKYVGEHTCAPSSKTKAGKTASPKTIGNLIMHRYDIRTSNPAESINSASRSPREYPIIPLLDSIREMLTQWFYNRDKIDCLVDLDRRTCSCGKYNLMKIPFRHAIKAGFHVGRQTHTLTDLMYTTEAWREAYHESINPIDVPEDAWSIPEDVVEVNVLPPDTRRSVGLFKYASCGV
ncbi:hypothetical protein F2Q70_00010399 [Brassica cretica]|uniref:Zinc finger PMZ-type domain-containing protein n=1 Tax=Brassica cretica TaxID=69181 RepID=A0A8S9M9M7_BRACR|nr:hypothetical protein F2Q70_00010399 [Brassica cretica]